MIMVLVALVSLTTVKATSQTIDQPPIYQRGYQSLVVEFLGYKDVLSFSFQDPDYKVLIRTVGFTVNTREEGIELMEEVIRIIDMPRTGPYGTIRHSYAGVDITRYSFAQNKVYLAHGLQINKRVAQKIINAIKASY